MAEKERLSNELQAKENEKEAILKEIRRINMEKEEYEQLYNGQIESKKVPKIMKIVLNFDFLYRN